MNHEPECPTVIGVAPCICAALRDAYQRGREDAAQAIEAVFTERVAAFEKSPLQERDEAFAIDGLEEAIAIVRGDGEQA